MKSITGQLVKLIVFAVVTVVATGLLGLTIANTGGGGGKGYKAVFSDASLLNKGDDVRIAGVRVGQVSQVEVYDRNRALVSFDVNRELPEGTQIYIRYRNLTGLRYLALERGAGDPTRTVKPGYTFGAGANSTDTHPAVNLTELFNGFRPLFRELSAADVNKLSEEIIAVFQGDSTQSSVTSLVANTAQLTSAVADKDAVIGDLITNLTKVLNTVNRNDTQFESLLDSTEKLVTGLAAQRNSVGQAITSVSNLTAVTASILTSTRPSIQGDIAGLKQLADQINARRSDVAQVLTNLPIKLQKIGRAATFGSWFQFYLCGIDVVAGNGKSTLLTQPVVALPNINHVLYTSAASRCWRDEKPGG
ncbi:MAG: MlaD family protein [Gordonia sp. (in: high G+C Gram-positive bacteria)]